MLRPLFLNLKERLKAKAPLIQVIMGPRQVGKTTGMVDLLKSFPQSHFVSADDELGLDANWLQLEWNRALAQDPSKVFVIDEIQNIPDWSRTIKGLWDKAKRERRTPRLVLLGSSALSLEVGLGESLAGRFELIEAPHWSWLETQKISKMSFEEYLSFGGYPGGYDFINQKNRWREYLQKSIVNNVLLKDILRLKNIKKPALLKQCFDLSCSFPAQILSYNKMLGQMQEGGNVEVIKHYLEVLESTFLIRCLGKFSGSKIKEKASSPKIIPLAPALITLQRGFYKDQEANLKGFVFEALVGSELAKLPGELYYWRSENQHEVDFVWKNEGNVWAIEVKSSLLKSQRGLIEFSKIFPKAKVAKVTMSNFERFAKDPMSFLNTEIT